MNTITEGKIIAFALNALIRRGFNRRLNNIFVEPRKSLLHFAGTG
jgi:hypothetical protein